MKELRVVYGPKYNAQSAVVQLNAYGEEEPLTPKMARSALRVAIGRPHGGTVWELPGRLSDGTVDYDSVYGYRVYENSARKVRDEA
jgi:hypothetical protein